MPIKSTTKLIAVITSKLLKRITFKFNLLNSMCWVERHSSCVVCRPLVRTHRALLTQWAQDIQIYSATELELSLSAHPFAFLPSGLWLRLSNYNLADSIAILFDFRIRHVICLCGQYDVSSQEPEYPLSFPPHALPWFIGTMTDPTSRVAFRGSCFFYTCSPILDYLQDHLGPPTFTTTAFITCHALRPRGR